VKRVDQTRFGTPGGNCYQACIASILEVDLEDVPDFCNNNWEGDWANDLNQWLYPFGLFNLEVEFDKSEQSALKWMTDNCWCVAVVPSADGGGASHAVVWHKGCVIHDPHPSRAHMHATPKMLEIFVARDPALIVRLGKEFSKCLRTLP
jgi:hypothetical protein